MKILEANPRLITRDANTRHQVKFEIGVYV